MDYAKFAKLSESERKRVMEINDQIADLQSERAKILKNKTVVFEEERDYLASKIPDFYMSGSSGLHRRVCMNPKYTGIWTGIRQAAEYKVFHTMKCPNDATDGQIMTVKKEMIRLIDQFYEDVVKSGLLW